jgi:hypothetical protein
MPAAGFFIIWEIIIPHGLMIWSWAAPLTAIIFVALTLFFFNYYKPIYKDIRRGLSYAAGSIRDKFVEKGSTPYGIIINYHIVVITMIL